MSVNMKPFFQKAKSKLMNFFGLWSACIASQRTYHAGTETDIGGAIDTASGKVLNEISNVYCGSLFFLLLGINIVVLAFSKNDKVLGVAKRTIIFIIAAYFILKMLSGDGGGKIGSTMETMSGWVS